MKKSFLIPILLIIVCQDIVSQNTCLLELINKIGLTEENILLYEKSLEDVPVQINSGKPLTLNSTLADRSIFLHGKIDNDKADIISSLLLYLDSDRSDTIKLYINSTGGSVYSALGIYDIMQMISSPIKTIGYGICASSAIIILSSGTKYQRFAVPNCRIMIHKPYTENTPSLQNDDYIKEMDRLTQEIYTILSENSRRKCHEIEKDCQEDYWLTPQKAVEYGIIDYVLR